ARTEQATVSTRRPAGPSPGEAQQQRVQSVNRTVTGVRPGTIKRHRSLCACLLMKDTIQPEVGIANRGLAALGFARPRMQASLRAGISHRTARSRYLNE